MVVALLPSLPQGSAPRLGAPVGPVGAQNILQVVAVETINVVSAAVFQAGELVVLGVVQTAHMVAQELADTCDPGAALAAGAAQANEVAAAAGARVVTAVDTAATNIRNALNDPFPTSTARPADPTVPSVPSPVSSTMSSLVWTTPLRPVAQMTPESPPKVEEATTGRCKKPTPTTPPNIQLAHTARLNRMPQVDVRRESPQRRIDPQGGRTRTAVGRFGPP
jgi:hypothetical protein